VPSLAEWEFIILVAESLVVAGILVAELYSLSLERKNHRLYSEFFDARTKWYNARNKKSVSDASKSLGVDQLVQIDIVPNVTQTIIETGGKGIQEELIKLIENVPENVDGLSMNTTGTAARAAEILPPSSSQLTMLTEIMEDTDTLLVESELENTQEKISGNG
jgi:hypothetical protein